MSERARLSERWKEETFFMLSLKLAMLFVTEWPKVKTGSLYQIYNRIEQERGGGPSSFFCFCFQNKWFLNGGRKGFILQFLWLLDLHFRVLIKSYHHRTKNGTCKWKGVDQIGDTPSRVLCQYRVTIVKAIWVERMESRRKCREYEVTVVWILSSIFKSLFFCFQKKRHA